MLYNLRIRGVDNNVAYFGSRYPRDTQEGEEFEILRPTICTKSRRVQEVQFDSMDPKVEKLARIASECPDYQMMIHHISRETPMKEIEDNSELKRMQGGLKDLAVYQAENGHSLIIRHGKEILIPVSERKELVKQLHSTHLESAMMKRLSRGRFFWPGYSKEIEEEFWKCLECRTEGISKPNKQCQVKPEDLTILAPVDYKR